MDRKCATPACMRLYAFVNAANPNECYADMPNQYKLARGSSHLCTRAMRRAQRLHRLQRCPRWPHDRRHHQRSRRQRPVRLPSFAEYAASGDHCADDQFDDDNSASINNDNKNEDDDGRRARQKTAPCLHHLRQLNPHERCHQQTPIRWTQ
jgi:hypothetical protein